MNIQRKYSLPNCTLLLEGLSDATKITHFQEMRPELSILVNAECHISGYQQPISGGRDFFESLVRAVNAYAQEFFSHIPNPNLGDRESELVQIQAVNNNCHRLIVRNHTDTVADHNSAIAMDLNTVQLFDLVEAVDQFFADTQTLPELILQIQSAPRRYGASSEALIQQAVPATIGVSSLAAAALAFAMLPAPEVRPPQPQTQEESANPTATTATPSPTTETDASANTPTPDATTIADNPTFTDTPDVKDLEALLRTVPEITDPSQLKALNRQVYNRINPLWTNRGGLPQDVVYRVGVAADGTLVAYKPTNKVAEDVVAQTPLKELLFKSANQKPAGNEPIAQYKVVFRRNGILEVSPWNGYSSTPKVIGEKITEANQLQELSKKLYDNIRSKWSGTPRFRGDLKYRVAVNKDGVIADYEPLNSGAFDYYRETPLPTMFQEVYGDNTAAANTKQPLAHYQVTFKPSGQLEIENWQGYR